MLDSTLIKKIWITEKTVNANAKGKYTFLVKQEATKNEVKKLVKELYKVDALEVNITTRPAKAKGNGRLAGVRGALKKATVTLKDGQSIAIQ